MNEGYFPHPTEPAPRKHRSSGLKIFLGLLALVVAGVATYVLLNRLSGDVLTIIATIGCAAGVALPGLLLGMLVLVRRAENSSNNHREEPRAMTTTTAPQLIVIPPMAFQQPQQLQPPPATWQQATQRQFSIVGDGWE